MNARRGFTLIEALFAVATVALLTMGAAVLYASVRESLEAQSEEIAVCGALRSEMERAVAIPFGQLAGGAGSVMTDGHNLTRTLTITPCDLDGNGTPETNAVIITVSVNDRQLSLLRADSAGRVGKH